MKLGKSHYEQTRCLSNPWLLKRVLLTTQDVLEKTVIPKRSGVRKYNWMLILK
ncbi:MAG: hypothetical protein JSC188_000514 [Candidatus Tokpelaia sp. JSC188]|nr:MAG: hypothetical protein JSC188_000514 [Candidatus Tokpelaia sp. JSC188]